LSHSTSATCYISLNPGGNSLKPQAKVTGLGNARAGV
jgi:hypothetical protein